MLSSYYFADDYGLNNPFPTLQGGVNVPGFNAQNRGRSQLVTMGFLTSSGAPSILPQRPGIVGVENLVFSSFSVGSTITGLNQVDNTFEYRDNFSRIIGAHTLKLAANCCSAR
jgi:hypothetical protein